MFLKLKILFFYVSKALGLFWLARLYYKKHLRILCYHGFSRDDEHFFAAGLFIRPEIFSQRMQYLADKKYNVITLQQSYILKQQRSFPDDAIVLTIDDGFCDIIDAIPIFKKHNFPSTLYLTSYYFDKDCPVFMLAVDYMFFKTVQKNISLKSLNIPDLFSQEDPYAQKKIIAFGAGQKNEEGRTKILKRLGVLLLVDYDDLNKSRILNLINKQELAEIMAANVDIQLHTHRHNFPENNDKSFEEIEKNKIKINPLLSFPQKHFCYPSGVWSKKHWSVLEKHGILTATTCNPKLINYDSDNYSLGRILDSERVSQIAFEAEVSGFNEIIRKIRGR